MTRDAYLELFYLPPAHVPAPHDAVEGRSCLARPARSNGTENWNKPRATLPMSWVRCIGGRSSLPDSISRSGRTPSEELHRSKGRSHSSGC
jgi:hypothetical protein